MYLYNPSVPFSHHKEYIVSFSCFLSALGFLELINNMLTTGMVPALYADDEREQIIGSVRKKRNNIINTVCFVIQYIVNFIYM